jgi:tetratricopeptide (TPR) repeat protein
MAVVLTALHAVESFAQISISKEVAAQAREYKLAGDNHLRNGKASLAITEYEKVLALNPHSTATYFNLAIARYSLKDLEGTIEALEKLTTLEPMDAEAHYNLGCLYLYKEDLKKARFHYEKAKEYAGHLPRFTCLIEEALKYLADFKRTDHQTQEVVAFLLRQTLPVLA